MSADPGAGWLLGLSDAERAAMDWFAAKHVKRLERDYPRPSDASIPEGYTEWAPSIDFVEDREGIREHLTWRAKK